MAHVLRRLGQIPRPDLLQSVRMGPRVLPFLALHLQTLNWARKATTGSVSRMGKMCLKGWGCGEPTIHQLGGLQMVCPPGMPHPQCGGTWGSSMSSS